MSNKKEEDSVQALDKLSIVPTLGSFLVGD